MSISTAWPVQPFTQRLAGGATGAGVGRLEHDDDRRRLAVPERVAVAEDRARLGVEVAGPSVAARGDEARARRDVVRDADPRRIVRTVVRHVELIGDVVA